MVKITPLMAKVEAEQRRPLEKLLPEIINERGLSGAAIALGVSKATIGYWLLKLGLETKRVTLARGETLEIKRTEGR